MTNLPAWQKGCPIAPDEFNDRIQLAHGEGARLSRKLIDDVIAPRLNAGHTYADAATFTIESSHLAVATDSHAVSPLFFPGGDIGSLAVYGTVNDVAVAGAVPQWMTVSLVLEEGLPMVVLQQVLDSISHAAKRCGVEIVAGDTKVVPQGTADGMFLNTTGIGIVQPNAPPGPSAVRPGDKVIVSGPVGRHGIAVLCARGDLQIHESPVSDCAPLLDAIRVLLEFADGHIRCIRDATRGGVSSVLQEWAAQSAVSFVLDQTNIPVTAAVRGACELMGLDPLYIANEGTFVTVVSADVADPVVQHLRNLKGMEEAAIIGTVETRGTCPVMVQRALGIPQPLDEPSGAPLPRIC